MKHFKDCYYLAALNKIKLTTGYFLPWGRMNIERFCKNFSHLGSLQKILLQYQAWNEPLQIYILQVDMVYFFWSRFLRWWRGGGVVASSLPGEGKSKISARSFQLQEIANIFGSIWQLCSRLSVEMNSEDTQRHLNSSKASIRRPYQGKFKQVTTPPPPLTRPHTGRVTWLTISFLDHNCKLVNAIILKCILFSNSKDVL